MENKIIVTPKKENTTKKKKTRTKTRTDNAIQRDKKADTNVSMSGKVSKVTLGVEFNCALSIPLTRGL